MKKKFEKPKLTKREKIQQLLNHPSTPENEKAVCRNLLEKQAPEYVKCHICKMDVLHKETVASQLGNKYRICTNCQVDILKESKPYPEWMDEQSRRMADLANNMTSTFGQAQEPFITYEKYCNACMKRYQSTHISGKDHICPADPYEDLMDELNKEKCMACKKEFVPEESLKGTDAGKFCADCLHKAAEELVKRMNDQMEKDFADVLFGTKAKPKSTNDFLGDLFKGMF